MTAHWTENAECLDMPAESFVVDEDGRYSNSREVKIALAICQRCAVIDACLADALESELPYGKFRYGIRGGKTPIQRYRTQKAISRLGDARAG